MEKKNMLEGYTKLFCAIIPTLFPSLLPFCYPYIFLLSLVCLSIQGLLEKSTNSHHICHKSPAV